MDSSIANILPYLTLLTHTHLLNRGVRSYHRPCSKRRNVSIHDSTRMEVVLPYSPPKPNVANTNAAEDQNFRYNWPGI